MQQVFNRDRKQVAWTDATDGRGLKWCNKAGQSFGLNLFLLVV